MSGFLAIASSTSNKAAISGEGTSWIAETLSTSLNWKACAWNGVAFVVVAESSSTGSRSLDGVTWSNITLPSAGWWSCIAWNGTVFCVLGKSGTSDCATSPDGITWTARTLPIADLWSSIAWNGTIFCAVATGSSTNAITSPDGITWTVRTLPSANFWEGIAWNGTVFCAISSNNSFATSPDGITWTTRTQPNTTTWAGITNNGSTFCIIDSNSLGVSYTSTDGITWTTGSYTPTAFKANYGLVHNGVSFCTVINNTNGALTSTNGLTWTARTLPSIALWQVLSTGTVLTSTTYNNTVSELISYNLSEILYKYLLIFDNLNISEALLYKQINTIVESILLNGSNNSSQSIKNSINEYFTIIDSIFIKYLLTITESIIYIPDILGIINQIENIVSSIILRSDVNTKIILLNNIIDLLVIIDILSAGINKTISESIVVSDTLSSLIKLINSIVESITIIDNSIIIYTGLERLESNINLLDTESDKSIFKNILTESFLISIPTASGQDNYLAYLLSPETNSITNYNNYDFKGCTKFNSKYLFYSETGLYKYGGDTDNEQLIESHVTTSALDFGSTNLKQVPTVYLGLTNTDIIYLKVSVDGKSNCLYKLNKLSSSLQTQRIEIGKGMIGRYFQFELISKASQFELESIDFYPIELKRKI